MQIIGITGGIGSGKSTIARELVKRGFTVYDCDREAKRIIAENPDVQKEIIDLLGKEAFIYHPSSIIYNTTYVAKRVFADPHLLKELNRIVHPAVKADILSSFTSHLSPLFLESAILFESGLNVLCNRIIVIDAPEDIRIARTIARDYHGDASPANINKVRARIHAQKSKPYTIHRTPYTILSNDGHTPIPELVDEILAVY
jgi:dephospho-CoA kinase